jgi:glycosyltransferase involved in cell wall biosynthesis
MKVYFDHQIFLKQKVGGISRYFYNLQKGLLENELCEVDSRAFIYRNSYVGKGNGAIYLKPSGIKKLDDLIGTSTALRYLRMVDEVFSLRSFKSSDCDVIHITDDNARYINKQKVKKPIVATVHDLIPELFPSHFDNITAWLKEREDAYKKADHLICISESTRKDLKDVYGFSDDKITMVYHGPADYIVKNKEYNALDPETQRKQKYVLYVGDRKTPYKNFWGMVENLISFIKDDKALKLLCIGSPFTPSEISTFEKFGLKNAVQSVQAPEDVFFSIYEQAACFILPSIYEGFGFPMLEAMKAGCPILSSNSSSLPEVGGNGALYFDPVTFVGFADQLKLILNNHEIGRQLKTNQVDCMKKFSWKNTAGQTYNVYRCLASV